MDSIGKGKNLTDLQLHPCKEVPSLSPPALLLEYSAHLFEAQLRHKRSHHLPHVIRPVWELGQRTDFPYRRYHMLPVQMPIPVVLNQLCHLLRGTADPPGGLRAAPLVAAEAAEVLRLGVNDAAGIIVGERLPRVTPVGEDSDLAGVPVAEAPRVR